MNQSGSKIKVKLGRKSKRDPTTVTKLVAALQHDYSIPEACVYAGIARPTFYRWLEEDKSFRDKVEAAKLHPGMLAREAIMDAITKKKWMAAAWWLERKMPEEFSLRQKLDIQATVLAVNLTSDQWQSLTEATNAASAALPARAGSSLPESSRDSQSG